MRHGPLLVLTHSSACHARRRAIAGYEPGLSRALHSLHRTCRSRRRRHSSRSENGRGPSANAKEAVPPTVNRLMASMLRSIATPQVRAVSSRSRTWARCRGFGLTPSLTMPPRRTNPNQKRPGRRPRDRRLASVDAHPRAAGHARRTRTTGRPLGSLLS